MRTRFVFLALGVLLVGVASFAAGVISSPAAPAKRRAINLPNRPVQAPFSDGVLAGDTLYLAGRIGIDSKTGQAPADLEQEIRIALDGTKATLAAAGMTMDDLAYVQVFCTDLTLFDKFNAVYRSYFQKDYPARAFIGAGALLRGGHFEIQAIAVSSRAGNRPR